MGVIPPFDVLEDGPARFGLGREPVAVEEFAFERGEEALGHRVVMAVADRAHRGDDAALAAALRERVRRVLAALVAVMDDLLGAAPRQRHVQRIEDQLGTQMRGHRPADHPASEHIDHDGEEHEAGPGRHTGDVGDPQPVGGVGFEAMLDEVRTGQRPAPADCC